MNDAKSDILFHPVRIRVVQALFGHRQLTSRELLTETGTKSIATLYRHLNRLTAAGILKIVHEHKFRGSVERTYALASETAATVSKAELRRQSPAEMHRAFAAFVATLLDDHHRYITHPDADPIRDAALTRQEAIYLTTAEAREAAEQIRTLLARLQQNEPRSLRRRYLITTILHPHAPPKSLPKESS